LHCVKCGGDIPEGSQACPACGLKLRAAPVQGAPAPQPPGPPEYQQPAPPAYQQPAPPEYGQQAPPQSPPAPPEYGQPAPPQYGQPQPPPAPPEYSAPGFAGTPAEVTRPLAAGEQQYAQPPYGSPGDAFAVPPAPYAPPGQPPPPGPYGAGPYGPGAAAPEGTKKLPTALIAIIVAGLLVIGVTAAVYFLVLKKSTPGGPEATVLKYFEILPGGDEAAIKALFTPDSQPNAQSLQALSMVSKMGASIKYQDAQLEVVSKTETDAQVRLKDLTIVVNMAGQSVKQKLSTYTGASNMVITLKKVNGQWLIVAPNGKLPSVGGSTGT
jgi:hypothetical protein